MLADPKGTEHIVIGTPGKVGDWGLKYKLIKLNKLTVFILDEADVMIATQGHQEQSIRIRKYVFICENDSENESTVFVDAQATLFYERTII